MPDIPGPKQNPPEMTVKAVALGLFLALVFGSANAYLGMRAGQTVAATIPAAVIAMALFRLPAFKGGLLEQNIARTAASVGEALVAGAIFTIPAFMMVDLNGVRLWTDLRSHYWEASLILLAGGLIGVFFIILLRRALVVEADLPFPESVASVEIVRAGQEAGDAPKYIFGAMGFAGLIQFLKSPFGVRIFREYSEGFQAFPQSVVKHFDFERKAIGDVTHHGGIPWSTPSLSPALIGIGYIIGPTLAAVNFSGGVLAWWIVIPLLLFFDPDLPRRIGSNDPSLAAYTLWFNIVRPIAVGMMLVGAANTMFSMRASLIASLKGAFAASSRASHESEHRERTDRDIPVRWVILSIFVLIVPITWIYYYFTQGWAPAIMAAVAMTVTGFLLAAVGGYLVGLVGSSNQPLSGLTLSALLIAALMMVTIGVTGISGVAAVLGVAAVVCVACSVSGSLIQDLKAGHLLGGTPWKMQVVEIVAVAMLAFFLMGPIIALHQANLADGGIGGRSLPAPQAGLMAQLTKGIVGGQMAWGLLIIGAAFGVALILCGARSPMLIAVGMYLPFDTTSAIFVGGVLKWLVDRASAVSDGRRRAVIEEKGTLLASGLIAGEAILGILLAVAAVAHLPSLTRLLSGGAQDFSWYESLGGWLSLLGFAAIAWVLVAIPLRARSVE
ncbi:MAG: oligopeptide transporter, OPT family [Acidobacteria bacterium]|nr:oligopeptide transporter, OPT family [Acidobacteriota bacterium]